jgi:DNA adenine methylase
MIYLNRTCYNGLYRVNRQGQFNVPFGSYVNPRICDAGNLAAVAAALRNVTLSCKPFDDVLERAQRKDFVYFDPPYDPVSVTACFTSYQPGGFSWGDQEGLSRVFSRLARCGVYVMLSNSATPSIRSLYRKWHIQEVDANRSINSKGSRRTGHTELIITSYPVDSSRDPG